MDIRSRGRRTVWPVLLLLAACGARPLSDASLENGTYPSTFAESGSVTLTERRFEDAQLPLVVEMRDPIARGDLDGDCDEDAVIFLAASTGGSGTFPAFVVVLNEGGAPSPVGTVELGDRVRIDAARIDEGVLVLDLTTHADSDPLCCPTLAVERRFVWEGGGVQELGP